MPAAPKSMTAAEIRRRLASTSLPDDPIAVAEHNIDRRLTIESVQELRSKLKAAGVLIPLIERTNGLSVLLTERSAELKHHAGQVSFPGGGMENKDTDIAATALREAHEEVGIAPHQVEIAGYLGTMMTITGYAVTPVVGFVNRGFELCLDPREVEEAFEVPLEFLLDINNVSHSHKEYRGVRYATQSFHYAGHQIWGATASIVLSLRNIIINNKL